MSMTVRIFVTALVLVTATQAQAANRFINFAGGLWLVKDSPFPTLSSPGPNYFDNSADSVWVDAQGKLHMKIQQIAGQWHSSQIVLLDSLDFGDYRFQVEGNPDLLDPNVNLGLFMFTNNTEEIDIELSRWTNPLNPNAGQFVVQPYFNSPDNIEHFSLAGAGNQSTYRFNWQPDSVFFEAFTGGGLAPQSNADILHQHFYNGPDVPPLAPFAQIYINLYQVGGTVPANGQPVEIIISDYAYTVPLTGDLNGDGFVGVDDLNLILGNWNQSAPFANLRVDPSHDNFVGVDDLNLVLGNWNTGTPPPPEALALVPEPASIVLLSVLSVAVVSRRRGR